MKSAFPSEHLIPKDDIMCSKFLSDYPSYDGRGVVVAVFDTGVDPAAAGLQVTSDGKPKIIDIIDPSGSGFVDTSKEITIKEDRELTLLSGRKIKVPETWNSADGKYRIGVQSAFAIFPSLLVKRLQEEAKKKWIEAQNVAKTDVERKLNEISLADKKNVEEKKIREEYEAQKSILNAYDNSQYTGPLIDCVLFNDGTEWLAVALLDTQEPEAVKVMTSYKTRQEYSTFTEEDMLSYSFNIYNGGKCLSIVVCSGSHGTHVAGILSANYPDNPEKNGIAPGAQIISVKIGDTRLDGMETGSSMIRGLAATIASKCDLINMSYGEDVEVSNVGAFTQLANEIVSKHNVIFVSSAGNDGPALSTATAPGGTSAEIISVGAYVSKSMMDVEYSMRENVANGFYTWSSRGPAYNGDYGVSIAAPGGAIASVPTFTLKGGQLMNGTSMASPNACGGIALVLSGLKQENIAYSPTSIRKAVENSAHFIPGIDAFTQGHGLLQVLPTFQYAKENELNEAERVTFEVRVTSHGHQSRGLYLREFYDLSKDAEATINIKPNFHEDISNQTKINFNVHLKLVCDAHWVDSPEHFVLMNEARNFKILVKSKSLPIGAHFAKISAYNVDSPKSGPLFHVPISVIKPIQSTEISSIHSSMCSPAPTVSYHSKEQFRPGRISRQFITVPKHAAWAEIKFHATDIEESSSRHIICHIQQFEVMKGHTNNEYHVGFQLANDTSIIRVIPVVPGGVAEFCFAQFWSSLGTCTLDLTIEFHGIEIDSSHLRLNSSDFGLRVPFSVSLRSEVVHPSVFLDRGLVNMRPSSAKISVLDNPMDILPGNKQVYECVLQYPSFQVDKKEDITPTVPSFVGVLYESVFHSQLMCVCDKYKRVIKWTDSKPKKITFEKGDYTIRLSVRSDDVKILERVKQTVLVLERHIKDAIELDVHRTFNGAVSKNDKFTKTRFPLGSRGVFFVSPPASNKIPSYLKQGDRLIGRLAFATGLPKVNVKKAGEYPFTYEIPPLLFKESKAVLKDEEEPKKTELEVMNNELRDKRIAHLSKLFKNNDLKDEFEASYQLLVKDYPDHIPVYSGYLKALDNGNDTKQILLFEKGSPANSMLGSESETSSAETDNENKTDITKKAKVVKPKLRTLDALNKIIDASNKIIEMIDVTELAAFFGVLDDSDDPKFKALKKENDDKKASLVDAYVRQANALLEISFQAETADYEKLDEIMSNLKKWCNSKHTVFQLLTIQIEITKKRYGSALKILNAQMAELSDKERIKGLKLKSQLLASLGWDHCVAHQKKEEFLSMPKSYPIF